MAKKSAISGEFIITVEDTGSIRVCKIADNAKGALRECAEAQGFAYDSNWTTRQFGSKLIKEFGDGTMAEIGEFTVSKLPSGSIEIFQVFSNTKGALRDIAEATKFDFDPDWNTRQFGAKLVDFINENK